MRRQKKYRPYVRRANGRERASSLREAFRLAFYQSLGKPFYVMVQRGFPNDVIGVGACRRDVQRHPFVVAYGGKSFRAWATGIQRHATKSA